MPTQQKGHPMTSHRFADSESAVTHVQKQMADGRTRSDAAIVIDRLRDTGVITQKGDKLVIPADANFDAEFTAWRSGK